MEPKNKQLKYASSSDYKNALANRQPGEKKHEHQWDEDPQPDNWGRMPDALACTVPGCTKEKTAGSMDVDKDYNVIYQQPEIRERKN